MKWLADLLEGSFSAAMTLTILAAALAGIPLLFGGFGSLFAGIISGRLIARTSRVARVRRSFGFIGMAGAAILLMASFYIRDPLWAMLSMGMANFFNDTTLPGSWRTGLGRAGKQPPTASAHTTLNPNPPLTARPTLLRSALVHSA